MRKKIWTTLGLILAIFTLVLAGCGGGTTEEGSGLADTSTAEGEVLSDSGVLVLKINPELGIKYNEEGVVTVVEGRNSDGRELLEQYPDFVGKDSGLVLEELVGLIGEAGYFVEETEGEPKQIVLELESGSILPEDEFLEKMTSNVQTAASNLNVDSNVLSNEDVMTLDEAKQIALDDAKVNAEDAKFDDQELDEEDEDLLFELEFYVNGYEYEYDVHAITGEIVKSERDHDEEQAEKDQKSKENNTQKEKPSKQQAKAKKNNYISMDRAKQIAFNHAGINGKNARFDDQEFDVDDGVPSYELEFKVNGNEYEYDVHAVSGEILEAEHDIKQVQEQELKADQKPATKKSEQLSKDEAITIALKHAGLSRSQVQFDDVELDHEDGRLEWEVEFEAGNWDYEYEVDGDSRKIIDFDKKYDD